MGTVTGGEFSYTRTVKPADYESKSATTKLAFLVDEGQDAQVVLEGVSKIAVRHTLVVVGLMKPDEKPKPVVPAGDALISLAAAEVSIVPDKPPVNDKPAIEAAEIARKRGRPAGSKNKVTVDRPPSVPVEQAQPKAAHAVALDQAAPVEAPSASTGAEILSNPEDRKDPADIQEDWTATPPPVTDEDLQKAVTAHNGRYKNPRTIKLLIGKYVKLPGGLRDILQVERRDFLDKLKKITQAD